MQPWFGRVRRMHASDYATAFEVVALAVWVEIAFRLMPVSRLITRLKHRETYVMALLRRIASDAPASGHEYQRLHSYVAIAYEALPLPATCLRRSLVLHGLLARRGVASRVCFGVVKNGDVLDAHAWVECDGIENDASHLRFNELTPAKRAEATESAEATG